MSSDTAPKVLRRGDRHPTVRLENQLDEGEFTLPTGQTGDRTDDFPDTILLVPV